MYEKNKDTETQEAAKDKQKRTHPFKDLSQLVSNALIFTKKDSDLKDTPIINTPYRNLKENALFKRCQDNNIGNNDRLYWYDQIGFSTADHATASDDVQIYPALTTPLGFAIRHGSVNCISALSDGGCDAWAKCFPKIYKDKSVVSIAWKMMLEKNSKSIGWREIRL